MPETVSVALSVDALAPNLTGIGRYCLELAGRLPQKLGADNLRYFRGDHWIDNPRDLLEEGWKPPRVPAWRRRIEAWQRRRAMAEAIVHAPNYFLPEWAERGVATIHDLSVLRFPETHPVERVRAFERQFENTLRRASVLVTDTETIRRELIDHYAVEPERIRAVPLGAPVALPARDSGQLRTLGLESNSYILCVSTFEPRKRIDHLVRAYRELPLGVQRRFPLVLAGATGWRSENLDDLIERASADGTVKRLGFVPDPLRDALYAGARLFVYPSRYEGFGLPVVEAMAHGVACIIADAPCLVEVARGAARIADPDDIAAFSRIILEALEDDAWRLRAAREATAVAGGYSWDRCATDMVAVYRSI